MLKISKIIFLFIILISLILNFTYATENETNSPENITTTITSDSQNAGSEDTSSPSSSFTTNFSGVTSVSQLSNYSEANLDLNNILNIILIAIGVLIILLSIAILIKLK